MRISDCGLEEKGGRRQAQEAGRERRFSLPPAVCPCLLSFPICIRQSRVSALRAACYNPRASFDAPPVGRKSQDVMRRSNLFLKLFATAVALCGLGGAASAQKRSKGRELPTTGAISGRVRAGAGASAAGISVEVRQGGGRGPEAENNAPRGF